MTVRLAVGTYPAAGPEADAGAGEGIWWVDLDVATGALTGRQAATTPAPSFVAVRGDCLLAVGETSPGRVTRFAVGRSAADADLGEREAVASGGSTPCHVLWHPSGRAAYVANYGSGSVAVVPLTPDADTAAAAAADDARPAFAGGVAQVFEHSGSGADADRQEGPHAHSTMLAPGGGYLLAADLGTDEIRRYRVAADGRLAEDGVAAVLPPGTGPRHMAAGPGDHVYVVGELDVTVHVLRWCDDHLEPVDVVRACTTPLRTGHRVLPAHVAVVNGPNDPNGPDGPDGPESADRPGATVLVSVRGSDVIARFAVHDDGARLVHEVDLPVGGGWPRHFAVVGDWVVAALQNADRVVALRWRDGVGLDGAVAPAGARGGELAIPVPACVVPLDA